MYIKPDRFPLTGPLEVDDYDDYLEKSKEEFYRLWDLEWVEDSIRTDFVKIKQLGKGAFGVVFLVKNKNDKKLYAEKTIYKTKIIKPMLKDHIQNEINVLKCLNFPFTIYLEHLFSDDNRVHFICPFISGGDLHNLLRRKSKFSDTETQFLGAQVVLSIEYLHSLDVIYRDLKPENLFLDSTGYLKLGDFGFSKIIKDRTYSLCGTPEYLAPEIILNKGYGKSVDWWATGILLFELMTGITPFYDNQTMKMFEKAVVGEFKMPRHFSPDLQDLIKNILQPNLTRRFGNLKNGADDIKKHKWFDNINWMSLFNRKLQSPFHTNEKTVINGKTKTEVL